MLNKEIIENFLQGKASKAEIEIIAEYIYSDNADQDIRKILTEEFEKSGTIDDFDINKSFEKIRNQISIDHNKSRVNKFFTLNTYSKVAAVFILFISAILFLIPQFDQSDHTTVVSHQRTIIKSTEKGQKLHLMLPDGSKVVLNSLSSIEYPETFDESIREVKLEGEAFFDVQKGLKPFEVLFADNKVSVLGTSFNISCREKDDVTIALVEGKISVHDSHGSEEIIFPGEMIRISNSGLVKTAFDLQIMIDWKDGWLNFNSDDFEHIVQKLEMWYGVEFDIIGSPVEDYNYSGRFRNKSLQEVLDGISYVLKFEYQIVNDKILIDFNK